MHSLADLNSASPSSVSSHEVYLALQALSVEEVGRLLLKLPQLFPNLVGVLPSMPPDDVQVAWTGSAGEALLAQSCAFVRSLEKSYNNLLGRSLTGARILDYGCGWGRLLRLMYKFSPPDKLYACDPWDKSLELCRAYGIRANLALCDYVPRQMVFSGVKFDLIYAFSVFTHLSERTAKAVMNVLRDCIAQDGMLVITIRPVEYWDVHNQSTDPVDIAAMKDAHARVGFAFTPHNRQAIEGDIPYGDTSMSFEYIAREYEGWNLVHHERPAEDPCQIYCYLTPRRVVDSGV